MDATPLFEFEGVLRAPAEVRMRMNQAGEAVPVLCLELMHVGPGAHTLHAEQPYTEATRAQALALAARLRKGARVCVQSGLVGVHMYLGQVQNVEPVAARH